MRARVLLALCAGVVVVACGDPRAWVAQIPFFASFQPALIHDCCACLASNGTRQPGAACAETFIDVDGGPAIIEGGRSIPKDADPVADDADGKVESFEVPCLCSDTAATCEATLNAGDPVVVTGSCVSQATTFLRRAPCESECSGVIDFDPLQPGP